MSAISVSQATQAVDMVCWRPSSYSLCVRNYSEPALRCHRRDEHKYFWRFIFCLVCIWSWLKSKHCNRNSDVIHASFTPPFTPRFITRRWKWHLQGPYDVGYIMNDINKATSYPEELLNCMLENNGIYISQIADNFSYDYSILQRCNAV